MSLDAMLYVLERTSEPTNWDWYRSTTPQEYTCGERGWTGDVPRMRPDREAPGVGWDVQFERDRAARETARDLVTEAD